MNQATIEKINNYLIESILKSSASFKIIELPEKEDMLLSLFVDCVCIVLKIVSVVNNCFQVVAGQAIIIYTYSICDGE